jgi:hypothetical protein
MQANDEYRRSLIEKCGIQSRSTDLKATPGFIPDARYALVPQDFQLCVQPTNEVIRTPNPRVVREFRGARYHAKIWKRDPRFSNRSNSDNEKCIDKSNNLPQMKDAIQDVLTQMGEIRGEWKGLALLSATHWSRTSPASKCKKRKLLGLPVWGDLREQNRVGWYVLVAFAVTTADQANQGTPESFCMAHYNDDGTRAPQHHKDTAIVLEIHPPRWAINDVETAGFVVQICDRCFIGKEGFKFECNKSAMSKIFLANMMS